MECLLKLANDEDAVASIEYALLGLLIAVAIVTAVGNLGTSAGTLYEHVANSVRNAIVGVCDQGC